MNDTCTVSQSHISITYDIECLFVLLCRGVCSALVQRLIFFAFQFFSLICLKHLVSRFAVFCELSEDRIQEGARHIVCASVCSLNLCVILFRMDAERKVRRQCPRRGCPRKDVCILVFYFKSYNCGALFYILISLSHFLGGKRGSAARAVWYDLKAFVEQPFIPDLLQSPPLGFYKRVVIGYIRVLHVSPKADRTGEILPHPLIFPHTLFTFIDERLQTILFNLVLSVQPQRFFNFQFHRKSVGIPSGFPRDHIPLHRAVTRDHVLDDTGQYMPDMRFPICCRRSVVENVVRTSFSFFDAFLKDMIFIPEFFNFFFSGDEIHIRRYFLVHVCFSFLSGPRRGYVHFGHASARDGE